MDWLDDDEELNNMLDRGANVVRGGAASVAAVGDEEWWMLKYMNAVWVLVCVTFITRCIITYIGCR